VIAPFAVRTPLLCRPAVLCERAGTKVFSSRKCCRRTGSFKFRGAFNKLSQSRKARAAAAWSRSRPATMPQGVAAAAKILNMQATI